MDVRFAVSRMRLLAGLPLVLGAGACGRIGFERLGAMSDAASVDGGARDGAVTTSDGAVAAGDGASVDSADGMTIDGSSGDAAVGFVAAPPCRCTHVSAGLYHSCARLESGTVRCWGSNGRGQLGDTSRVDRLTPADVPMLAGALDVVAGGQINYARLAGAVACWGGDSSGMAGDGPGFADGLLSMVSGVSDATQVAAARYHMCLVRADGQASCAGLNDHFQLVDGTSATSRNVPVGVVGIADAVQAGTGSYYTCFRRRGGTVECAGINDYGQLGDGTTIERGALAPVSGLSDIAQIAVGPDFACARTSVGGVWCWGRNDQGQLGDDTVVDRPTPVAVVGLSDAIDLSVGGAFACAVRSTGVIACWGASASLGIGMSGASLPQRTPVEVLHLTGATDVEAGEAHACAIAGGGLYCWGSNSEGQLGDGTIDARGIATPVVGL